MKKILLTALSLVTVAVVAVVGTVAYLTWDDSDVNVMTMGNVSIAQHEYQRATNEDGTYKTDTIDNQNSYVLQDFTQGKALLPATDPTKNNGAGNYDTTTVRMSQVGSYGGMQVFVNSNAQDKFVTVENTGKTDAYIRTLVAIECGDGDATLVGSSFHFTWTNNRIGIIEIDGNKYYLTEYVYNGAQLSDGSWRHGNGILPAGDTSYPSLSQVYLHSRATNEDCEALDGNDNGSLDILVLSQAVQAQGFADAQTALDTAFGKSSEKAAEWFIGVVSTVVETFEELKAAFAKGGAVTLADDIVLEEPIVMNNGENVVLNMNGKTITPASVKADPFFDTYPGTSLVITGNGTFDLGNNPGMSVLMPGGDVIIKNGTFLKGRSDNVNGPLIAAYSRAEGEFIIEGGYFDSGYYKEGDCFNNCRNGVNLTSGNTYRIYGGTFVGQNPAWGDEGRAVLCPHCNNNGSNCQGVFLEGQTKTSTELPEGYTITEGTTADGRPTYTVTYGK